MHSEGLCDAPRLGMHVYMLVQTCGGSFMVAFGVKTQRIQNHNLNLRPLPLGSGGEVCRCSGESDPIRIPRRRAAGWVGVGPAPPAGSSRRVPSLEGLVEAKAVRCLPWAGVEPVGEDREALAAGTWREECRSRPRCRRVPAALAGPDSVGLRSRLTCPKLCEATLRH